MSKGEQLHKELKEQIERFNKESTKHKRLYRMLRFTAFGLTACSTILASAALSMAGSTEWLNLAVVIATAAAGVASSIEGLRKPAELWIHERNILYSLKDLEREMKYEAAQGGTVPNVDQYFHRLQAILSASREKWSRKVKSASGPN